MAKRPKTLELVGPVEIARLLHVQLPTVYRWRSRQVLPEPGWFLSGSPIWRQKDIIEWAEKTGRTGEVAADDFASLAS